MGRKTIVRRRTIVGRRTIVCRVAILSRSEIAVCPICFLMTYFTCTHSRPNDFLQKQARRTIMVRSMNVAVECKLLPYLHGAFGS